MDFCWKVDWKKYPFNNNCIIFISIQSVQFIDKYNPFVREYGKCQANWNLGLHTGALDYWLCLVYYFTVTLILDDNFANNAI